MAQDPTAPSIAQGVAHYENFPVASWLCPAHLRAPIAAIYWFARTADDLADEGQASARQRLFDLAHYRADLDAVAQARAPSSRWASVFEPLKSAIAQHQLPVQLLFDLLSAFEQDVHHTDSGQRYATSAQLLDYCERSANPVGRLLLHLYGIEAPATLKASDAVCTALQLINFWQDLGADIRRQRHYLPLDACEAAGLSLAQLSRLADGEQPGKSATDLVASQAMNALALMQLGSNIVHQVPGRAGWELRGVVQGGLSILDGIARVGFNTWHHRPTLRRRDMPGLVWRALWM